MKVQFVRIKGDFQLVIRQLSGEYQYLKENIIRHYMLAKELLNAFFDFELIHNKRNENTEANKLLKWHPVTNYLKVSKIHHY